LASAVTAALVLGVSFAEAAGADAGAVNKVTGTVTLDPNRAAATPTTPALYLRLTDGQVETFVILRDRANRAVIANSGVLSPGDQVTVAWNKSGDGKVATEMTAYGAAWKTGATWPVGPVPTPIGYVTRAGYLWKNGEAYHYDRTVDPTIWPTNAAVWVTGAASAP
jgi:hypothetical protein